VKSFFSPPDKEVTARMSNKDMLRNEIDQIDREIEFGRVIDMSLASEPAAFQAQEELQYSSTLELIKKARIKYPPEDC
jgi:hypothetical protein